MSRITDIFVQTSVCGNKKETVRMDKVNIALSMFDMEAVLGRKEKE